MSNKWKRVPDEFGFHWFIADLKDWNLAKPIRVSKIQIGNDPAFFTTTHDEHGTIKGTEGWFLKIDDERLTAEIEWPIEFSVPLCRRYELPVAG